jgi:hypothetical protein
MTPKPLFYVTTLFGLITLFRLTIILATPTYF